MPGMACKRRRVSGYVARAALGAMSAAACHAHARVGLLDKPDDLLVCESALTHRASIYRLRGFFSISLARVVVCMPPPRHAFPKAGCTEGDSLFCFEGALAKGRLRNRVLGGYAG